MCSCSSSAETPCAVSWPPSQSVSSSSTTRRPARAAAIAAATPPVPPPAISSSQSSRRETAGEPTGSTASDASPLAGTFITSTTASTDRCIYLPGLLPIGLRARLLPPVVIRGEAVRRIHRHARRHDVRRVRALRLDHLGEERVFLGEFLADRVPRLQLLDQHLVRRAPHVDAVLAAHLGERLGVLAAVPQPPAQVRVVRRHLDDFLQVGR